jgi:hypothetical protein
MTPAEAEAVLRKGRAVTDRRNAFKRGLRDTAYPAMTLAGFIESCPEWLATIRVRDLVRYLPRVGPARAKQLVKRAGIEHEDARLHELTDRERWMLAHVVQEKRTTAQQHQQKG